MTDTPPLQIAVVGAGPAGLTFASILHRKANEQKRNGGRVPWQVTLYEAERSPDARRVGGSLDLGRKTGLRALEAAGLFNRFHDFARPEGQEIRLMNHHGEMVFHYMGTATPDDDSYSPEIDRSDLNRILVESIPPDAIQWDHKLNAVHPQGGKYELQFADGATALADVVVGADGAWSHVRPLVTDENPTYPDVDATFLDIKVRKFNARFPDLADLVGKGTLYSFGGGNTLVAQRNRRDVVHVYLGVKAPPDWRQHELLTTATNDRERVQIFARAFFADWGEQLRMLAMVAADSVDDEDDNKGDRDDTETTLLVWPLYAIPVGVHWPPRRGVTLIGDAAHLMSPCAGEGVNTAMIDAMELAQMLARPVDTADDYHEAALDAIESYEREMFKRVETPARRSAENLATFFNVPKMTMDHAVQMFGPIGRTMPPGSA